MSNRSDPGPGLRALLRSRIGTAAAIEPTARGFGTDLTAVVEGENGRFFVKAMKNRPGGRRDQMLREKVINRSWRCWPVLAKSP
jgi:hypothetical protein